MSVERKQTRPESQAAARSGVRAASLRRANLSAVLQALRFSESMSRSELVDHTGLTRSAVGSLVTQLVGVGLVTEAGADRAGQLGRPSVTAAIDTKQRAALAVEVVVDEIAVAIVNLRGEILDVARMSRPHGDDNVADTVRHVGDLARLVGFDGQRAVGRRIVGVGVAAPGLVRLTDDVLVAAPNLGWTDIDIATQLATELGGHVPVVVGNEADLGALAESRFGSGVDASTMVYVAGEVGVGGGVIVNGQRLRGRSGFGGEVGHFPVNPSGLECGCGSVGCWETEVGERALLQRAGRDADGGSQAIQRLVHDAQLGDDVVLDALAEHGGWVAIGVAGLINIFDPDKVVLGGLFGEVWPHIESVVMSELGRTALGGQRRSEVVVPSRLGASARLVGAAELAFEPLLDDPVGG